MSVGINSRNCWWFCWLIAATFPSVGAISNNNDRSSKGALAASLFLDQTVDRSRNVCSDFFGFVCANYGNASDARYRRAAIEKTDTVVWAVASIFERVKSNRNGPLFRRKLLDNYERCVRSLNDSSTLYPALYAAFAQRFGDFLSDKIDFRLPFPIYTLGKLRREIGIDFGLVEFRTFSPVVNKTVIDLDSGQLTSDDIPRENFTELLWKFVDKLQLDDERLTTARRLINVALELQEDFDRAIGNRSDFSINIFRQASQVTGTSTLNSYLKGMLGTRRLAALVAKPDRFPVIVWPSEYISTFKSWIQKVDKRAFMLLAFWKYGSQLLIKNNWSLAYQEHNSSSLCAMYMMRYAPSATARLYFDEMEQNGLDWKNEIESLITNINKSFAILVDSSDWLHSFEKKSIISKLKETTIIPVVPSWINDDDAILKRLITYDNATNFVSNILESIKLMNDRSAESLDDDTPEIPNHEPSFSFYARYTLGIIQVSLGAALPPTFDISYPTAVKYGGLGAIVAHEMVHALLNEDGLISEDDKTNKMFDNQTVAYLNERRDCLVEQYWAYCNTTDNDCTSGPQTYTEDVADREGNQIAFDAYLRVRKSNGDEPPLPHFTNYTGEQLFYITMARLLCTQGRQDPDDRQIDTHSPERVRVNVTVANMKHFSDAFGCSRHSESPRVCTIWQEKRESDQSR